MKSVLSLSQLGRTARRLRRQGKKVAFTNGCFDLLHVGHLEYLQRLKAKADCLIVAVNSDASVRRLKGAGRPLVPAAERARMVAALKPVDFVTIFPESTPLKVIRAIRPDLLAKGADWKRSDVVGGDGVGGRGGRVVLLPFVKGRSTTRLIRRIQGKGR